MKKTNTELCNMINKIFISTEGYIGSIAKPMDKVSMGIDSISLVYNKSVDSSVVLETVASKLSVDANLITHKEGEMYLTVHVENSLDVFSRKLFGENSLLMFSDRITGTGKFDVYIFENVIKTNNKEVSKLINRELKNTKGYVGIIYNATSKDGFDFIFETNTCPTDAIHVISESFNVNKKCLSTTNIDGYLCVRLHDGIIKISEKLYGEKSRMLVSSTCGRDDFSIIVFTERV